MEKLTLLLPDATVQMLHLLARSEGQTIGRIVQEMALDRYMTQAMGHSNSILIQPESVEYPLVQEG